MNNKFNCYCKSCGQIVGPDHAKVYKNGFLWEVNCGNTRYNLKLLYNKKTKDSTYVPRHNKVSAPLVDFFIGVMFQ